MRLSQEGEEEENDEFYSLEDSLKKQEQPTKSGSKVKRKEKKKCAILLQKTIAPNKIMNVHQFKMPKTTKTLKMGEFGKNMLHHSESISHKVSSENEFECIDEKEEITPSDKKKRAKSSSGAIDHQRGGGDAKGFLYSFNPKVNPQMITALVPYKNKKVEYLQQMLPQSPGLEIAEEITYKSQYKQVQKIINHGGYDFDNPRPIDLESISKLKPQSSYFGTRTSMNRNDQDISNCHPLEIGYNIENYLLYKNLSKGKKFMGMSLNPVQQYSSRKLSPVYSERKKQSRIDKIMEISNQPVHDRLYQESTYSSAAGHLPASLRPNLMSIKKNRTALSLKRKEKEKAFIEEEEFKKEAEEFVNKLNKEKEKREKRKHKIIRLRDKKHHKELKEIIRQRERQEQEKQKQRFEKRQQIIARVTKLKEERKKAKTKMRDWSHKPSRIPLYLQKEMQFQKQKEEEENRKRITELNNRKDIYKRISISEIRRHARMHDDTVESNVTVLRNRRMQGGKSTFSIPQKRESTSSLSSKFLKSAIEEEREHKALMKFKEEEAKEKREKANRFS
ncbi:unnamed protein product [Moneuplotes crassus]|uniref:Uncharacterized protein n=1 Tax=Euplotes crassus TaxID=5936 RepID=A0AAD2D9D5_EUPCR|nr:unnamed protein product [Moneuplotes crassus]